MRVLVRHGHFAFYPQNNSEVWHFRRLFKLELFPEQDYYTFQGLLGLPRWSQLGRLYGPLPAIKNYEGRNASEVMRENGLVYSLATGLIIPFAGVTTTVALPQSRDYAIAPKPLIQPGSILTNTVTPGNRILGYEGHLDLEFQRLYISSMETLV